ncbi:MAG: hypothetical protein KIH06_00375 [Kiritimatiellae bacterium]|nr:hypothetical protein [Kiritimatiellia bacterium]
MTAAEKILQKALVGSKIDSSQWNRIQAALRDRAFFSSKVESARMLHSMRGEAAKVAAGTKSASEVRRDLRQAFAAEGYKPMPDDKGTIKDLYTKHRLDTVIQTNVRQARGFVQYLDGISPGALAAFPAQELIRVRNSKTPRNWAKRWTDAGGKLRGGRMVALKTDPIWTKISAFGNPFPPYDWGSGMGIRDIKKSEAKVLGLILDDEAKAEAAKCRNNINLNGTLQAEIPFKGNTNEWKQLNEFFEDQITHKDGYVIWRGNLIRDAFSSGTEFEIRLGKPTDHLRALLPPSAAKRVKNKSLTVKDDWLERPRQGGGTHRDHFEPRENDPRNLPLTDGDLELIPTLWRKPDRVLPGGYDGSFICELDTIDDGILRMVVDVNKTPKLHTLYKRKSGKGTGGLN